MPHHASADERSRLRDEIEVLVEHMAARPFAVALHRRLREASIRHKAAGGRDVGMSERLRRTPKDPLRRLLHGARLWAFDPGDAERLASVARAVDLLALESPEADAEPLRRWLKVLSRAMRPSA